MPALSSLNPAALSLAAALAVFRFKIGMLRVLAGCAAAGVLLYLARSL